MNDRPASFCVVCRTYGSKFNVAVFCKLRANNQESTAQCMSCMEMDERAADIDGVGRPMCGTDQSA